MAFVKKTNSSSSKPAGKAPSTETFTRMVSERAYYIWEEKGRPEGRDLEIWLQAEKDVRAKIKK